MSCTVSGCNCKSYMKHKWKNTGMCITCKHHEAKHPSSKSSNNNTNNNGNVNKATNKSKQQQPTQASSSDEDTTNNQIVFSSVQEAISELTEYMQECKIESTGLAETEEELTRANKDYIDEINTKFDLLSELVKERKQQLLKQTRNNFDSSIDALKKQKYTMDITYKTLQNTLDQTKSDDMKTKEAECIDKVAKVLEEIPQFKDVSIEYAPININSIKLFISQLGDPNSISNDPSASLTSQLNSDVMLQQSLSTKSQSKQRVRQSESKSEVQDIE